MRENQNIAHCSVCSEKTHCRFSFPNIPHRLNSTESKFHSFLSLNLPNNMGDIWKILIQNGCRFITHSPTISRIGFITGLMDGPNSNWHPCHQLFRRAWLIATYFLPLLIHQVFFFFFCTINFGKKLHVTRSLSSY